MRLPVKFRSMNAIVFLWIILPLALVILSTLIAAVFAYQQNVILLVLNRQYQTAQLAAATIAASVDEYALLLKAAGTQSVPDSSIVSMINPGREELRAAQTVFSGGIFYVDKNGKLNGVDTATQPRQPTVNFANLAVFQQAHDELTASFGDLVSRTNDDTGMIFIAVPLLDEEENFNGALVGGLDPFTDHLGSSIRNLVLGEQGYAYLVDRAGIILAHPDMNQVGKNFSDRPFIHLNGEQENSGLVWRSTDGVKYVGASAPVAGTGWRLIVKEPLRSILAPAYLYGTIILLIGLLAIALVALFVREGTLLVTAPIQELVDQTTLLASGERIKAKVNSGILEIDHLGSALEQMSIQMANYRTGLRRYVGAITRAQEEERLRIAHELHDETIQSLLAVARRIELYRTEEADPVREQHLDQLQAMINQTVTGLRHVSQDLRPMALEDLGLVPAIQMLVRAVHQGEGAIPHALFESEGSAITLKPEQQLALYRITQEALTNIRKHADATAVWVELIFSEKKVQLSITDDGKGFSMPSSMNELVQEGRLGLMGIQERVWSVEGLLDIDTKPGGGTKITVTIPI
jgi:signal transduction histidine kinase